MINTSESRIIFNGNGTATEFPYSFAIINDTDVKVMTVDPDGVETVLDSDYYVDVTASKVIYPGYPPGEEPAESERPPVLPTGWQLVVYRDIPITQEANLGNVWPFNVIEDALDKITMILQTSRDTSDRSLKVSESAPSDVDFVVPIAANMALKRDAQGKRIVLTTDPAKVLPQAQDLLQQTTEQANIATNKANAAADSALAAATSESNVGAHEDKAQAWAESETSPDGEPDSKSAKTWAGDSADSAEMAQKWAESENSPDGEEDADSPTGKSMSAKQWALYAKEQASAIAAYPVGTVYISTVNKSPATIFGGTWEALPAGRVLLAQGESDWGTSYPAGSTGGEATHTLTTDEMPSHTHNITATAASVEGHEHDWYSGTWGGSQYSTSADSAGVGAENTHHKTKAAGSHSHDIEASADTAGGGNAHNNMQPYLSVYMWKRTA